MYRTLKTFYFILACLSYKKRRKLTNVFILTLESYKIIFHDVVEVFSKSIKKLNYNVEMKINKECEIICVFVMTFFENMSQQTNNIEFFRHNANIRYCTYLCFKRQRDNLQYDIVD